MTQKASLVRGRRIRGQQCYLLLEKRLCPLRSDYEPSQQQCKARHNSQRAGPSANVRSSIFHSVGRKNENAVHSQKRKLIFRLPPNKLDSFPYQIPPNRADFSVPGRETPLRLAGLSPQAELFYYVSNANFNVTKTGNVTQTVTQTPILKQKRDSALKPNPQSFRVHAEAGTRTPTAVRPLDPEPSASTSSATSANYLKKQR